MVDDHPAICKAVSDAITSTDDLEMCGYAGHFGQAFPQIEECSPDVAIVDISLPDGHGLDLVRVLQTQCPEVKILIFSMYDETVYAERALRAGASGYLMKTEPVESVLDAVRTVERDETYLSRPMTSQILDRMRNREATAPRFAIDELTNRERDVFRMLGEGKSLGEIQKRLGISRKTVETHRRRARKKLGAESIPELLQYAMQWAYGQNGHGAEREA